MTVTEQPAALTRDDVVAAADRIAGRVRRTPVLHVEPGVLGPVAVTLKLEHLQHTGSFKARGALSALLSASEADGLPEPGVVAASGGNHGLAVSWAAAQLDVRAAIFVPTTAPAGKVAGLRAWGADVHLVGERYSEALAAAVEHQHETGALAVHAYDEPAVVAGQGTVGLELSEQVHGPEQAGGVDTVLVAVGGGGLSGGIAAALTGEARVVGVEPEGCPSWHAAFAAGGPVDVEVGGLGADALGATRLGDVAWSVLEQTGAASVLVEPDDVARARQLLWQRLHLVVEAGGAVAVAALLSGAYVPADGERVAVVLCGANTDPGDLAGVPSL